MRPTTAWAISPATNFAKAKVWPSILRRTCSCSFAATAHAVNFVDASSTHFVPALLLSAFAVLLALPNRSGTTQVQPASYLGFDLNEYPGDDGLPVLRKTFSFTGYWLSPPPGEKRTNWLGKRQLLQSQGFGFMVLFNGRESRNLKSAAEAKQKGIADGEHAGKARPTGRLSARFYYFSGHRRGRPFKSGVSRLCQRLDRHAVSIPFPQWNVLFRHACERWRRQNHHHRQRPTRPPRRPTAGVLDLQRRLPPFARLRFPSNSSRRGSGWDGRGGCLAIRAEPAPQTVHSAVRRNLCARRELLRTRRCRTQMVSRRQRSELRKSFRAEGVAGAGFCSPRRPRKNSIRAVPARHPH